VLIDFDILLGDLKIVVEPFLDVRCRDRRLGSPNDRDQDEGYGLLGVSYLGVRIRGAVTSLVPLLVVVEALRGLLIVLGKVVLIKAVEVEADEVHRDLGGGRRASLTLTHTHFLRAISYRPSALGAGFSWRTERVT
jgi:hypothetical protein